MIRKKRGVERSILGLSARLFEFDIRAIEPWPRSMVSTVEAILSGVIRLLFCYPLKNDDGRESIDGLMISPKYYV